MICSLLMHGPLFFVDFQIESLRSWAIPRGRFRNSKDGNYQASIGVLTGRLQQAANLWKLLNTLWGGKELHSGSWQWLLPKNAVASTSNFPMNLTWMMRMMLMLMLLMIIMDLFLILCRRQCYVHEQLLELDFMTCIWSNLGFFNCCSFFFNHLTLRARNLH